MILIIFLMIVVYRLFLSVILMILMISPYRSFVRMILTIFSGLTTHLCISFSLTYFYSLFNIL